MGISHSMSVPLQPEVYVSDFKTAGGSALGRSAVQLKPQAMSLHIGGVTYVIDSFIYLH